MMYLRLRTVFQELEGIRGSLFPVAELQALALVQVLSRPSEGSDDMLNER